MTFLCTACSQKTLYEELPQPRVFLLGQDFSQGGPPLLYIICHCGEKAYAQEKPFTPNPNQAM